MKLLATSLIALAAAQGNRGYHRRTYYVENREKISSKISKITLRKKYLKKPLHDKNIHF